MAEHGLRHPFLVAVQRARRGEKFITLALLFVLLTAATAGVTNVLTGPDWTLLWESLLFGLLVGWLLAILRWSAWKSVLVVIAIGILFSTLSTGGLSGKFWAVFQETLRLPIHASISLKAIHLDTASLISSVVEASGSTRVVFARVILWVEALFAGQSTFDPVAASFVWSALVWLVAAWAGWIVEAGKNPLLAVLPAVLLNLSTLSYGRSGSLTIYLILGIALALIGVVQYDQREQEWDETHVAYPSRKDRQVGFIAVLLAILLVIASAFLSTLSFKQITRWASELRSPSPPQESGLAKSLGIRSATAVPDVFSQIRSPGLPRDLLIGSGPELSTEVIMSVQVNFASSLKQGGRLPPLYWRSFTYDIYTGHGWSSGATQQVQYSADQQIEPESQPNHLLVQERVRPVAEAGGIIYTAGEPVSVSIPSEAAWRSSGDLFGIQAGKSEYDAESLIPVADENRLRTAGQVYPAWITQRYLALPQEVPARVKALALQLTGAEPTPYDRARAIEQYLRKFPYTLDISRPPANQDLVDYFLNDLRKGYCDYYASAMVVLARAAGIPARLVVGYASGTYNLNSGRFVVTQADAHSWVEVYFPGIGWVPFEPTASQQEINRSSEPIAQATPTPPSIISQGSHPTQKPGYLPLISTLVFLGLFAVAWAGYDEIRLQRMNPQFLAAEIYRRMRRYGRLMKIEAQPGETAYEYGEALSTTALKAQYPGENENLSPKAAQDIQSITRAIVRLSYRPVDEHSPSGKDILHQWRALRWQLRIMYVVRSWQSLQRQFQERLDSLRERGSSQA